MALKLISSLFPAHPGSRPPALASPGPFSGLVYKNGTAPVYTALKGVRSCLLAWEGESPSKEVPDGAVAGMELQGQVSAYT